jgi:hypothetical protein
VVSAPTPFLDLGDAAARDQALVYDGERVEKAGNSHSAALFLAWGEDVEHRVLS